MERKGTGLFRIKCKIWGSAHDGGERNWVSGNQKKEGPG